MKYVGKHDKEIKYISEKIAFEEFGKEGEIHEFSNRYLEQKRNLLKKAKGEEYIAVKKSTFTKKKIAILIVAAVLTLGTVSVVAAAYINWSKSLSEGMRATQEQKAALEESKMTSFVGQSVTEQGITVTATQIITDNYFTYLTFKVEGFEVEEGIQPWFEGVSMLVDGENESNYGHSFYNTILTNEYGEVVDAQGNLTGEQYYTNYVLPDGSMEYHIVMGGNRELGKGYFINKPIHVEMVNLGICVGKIEYENQIEAKWSFDFNLQGASNTSQMMLNKPIGDTGATIIRAEISPISTMLEYGYPKQIKEEEVFDQDGNKVEHEFYMEPPAFCGVKLKDGTIQIVYGGQGQLGYDEGDTDIYRALFENGRIIDIDQIESILFADLSSNPSPEEGKMEVSPTEEDFIVVPVE